MLVNHDIPLGQEIDDIAAGFAPRKKRRGPTPESATQRAIIKALYLHGIMAMHIPNSIGRSLNATMNRKRDGMVTGWPDLAVYGWQGRHCLFEVKPPSWKAPRAPKIGEKPTEAFYQWALRLRLYESIRSRGIEVEVVQSIDDALRYLRAWGWLAPR